MILKDKKILLVRLSALGDVCFNIPLANLLKKHGATLHWLVSEKGYSVIKNNPCNDKTILAPVEKWKKEKNKFKNIAEYFSLIKEIRKEKYDILIDTQGILKSLIWTLFSGAKRRIVSKSAREGAIIGGNEFIEPIFKDFKTHAVDNYFKFLKHLGINDEELILTLPESCQEDINYVDNLLIKNNKQNLLIAPATTWKNKHWLESNWVDLIKKIDLEKYNLYFTGTKSDINLINRISGGKGINLAGKTNPKQLIELFKHSDILISLDSGSTHLAWLTSKPKIISIFLCTPKARYAPKGDKHIAFEGNLPCQPCHKKHCPKGTNACIYNPTAEEVYSALSKI